MLQEIWQKEIWNWAETLNSRTNLNYSTFQEVFLENLNKIVSNKFKVLQFNNNFFLSAKEGHMKTGIIIRSKGTLLLDYSTKPKKNILMILM